ncbi:unnamed protein product [Victoria cruziana]
MQQYMNNCQLNLLAGRWRPQTNEENGKKKTFGGILVASSVWFTLIWKEDRGPKGDQQGLLLRLGADAPYLA